MSLSNIAKSRRSPGRNSHLVGKRSAPSLSDSDSYASIPTLLGPNIPKKPSIRRLNKHKFVNSGYGNNRKRKPSAALSEVSFSDSDVDNDDDEDEDNEDAVDDDSEQSEVYAPSYGRKPGRNRKTGRRGGLSLLKDRKRVKLQHSDYESCAENSSVSSASPLSSVKSIDLDSDDGYEAVNDVSDADDEEQEIELMEEELILDSEYERDLETVTSALPSGIPDEWLGLDDLENRPLYSTGSFFEDDQLFLQSGNIEAVDDHVLTSATVDVAARRVHFAESDDSSDSDKTTDDELTSDFLQQDALDPDLRRMIENDSEPLRRPLSSEFLVSQDFYDLPGNIYHVETESSVASSSGYESDCGETTDEDLPPPATITHPRSILRRDSSASLPPFMEESTQRSQPLRRRGPLRGTFVADPHKPVAVVAPNGAQLILIPPYSTSRHDWLESATQSLCNTANNSPRPTAATLADDSDTDALVSPMQPNNLSPMLSSNANLMITALGSDSVGQITGPPEAFYPSNGLLSFDEEDEDDDSEGVLNVNDFIDFGNGSSDEEDLDKAFDAAEDLASAVGAGSPSLTMNNISMTTTTDFVSPVNNNSAERLLNHLDRGIVTAFRRNHSRYQALIRLPQHREFVPANSPSRPASVFRRSKYIDNKTPTRRRTGVTYTGGEAVRRKLVESHRSNSISF
ncbi:hypothetical protein RJZ56_000580 [Blastomyces dermatitidis]|uniref:Uncharacterized protein n=3 Tax=Blastomyces TaxID=229219 RepID=A0A179UG46_BLAGS|nr:uncharacterized protein BDBG_03123 [Blastomyces gilchristii SLH14081]XP_045272146.1 uncharacterized protein BDCG_00900 [Blastomyces dermatitidis ER-3]EGE79917.1 hypothetical protein BDDG_02858 [Blastomyces dermatitidis ATCC 18188]EQL31281.1 hypothetical protein BDFG_06339 [Blastomyces dermatitidis ATCC 26199]EEQ84095.1 hypothetical protein BDCG_00900 [Blastomyces dermatitidis ER-3]OAT07016.1 hypothetical protein BDBG_03123 [Blastomyces gilchristii SLH14081]